MTKLIGEAAETAETDGAANLGAGFSTKNHFLKPNLSKNRNLSTKNAPKCVKVMKINRKSTKKVSI